MNTNEFKETIQILNYYYKLFSESILYYLLEEKKYKSY
jgi:hypothetical protein